MRIAILLLSGAWAFAQSSTITGTVTDYYSRAFANATIQAFNVTTRTLYKAESSATGSYTLGQLPAGTYNLLVTVPGMQQYQKRNIVVGADQIVQLPVRVEEVVNLSTLGDGRNRSSPHSTPVGPTPRTADGKPDLSGMWYPQNIVAIEDSEPLPWAQALITERMENQYRDYPLSRCLPSGVTVFGSGSLMFYRVIQAPAHVVMIDQDDVPGYRLIFLDGRGHPKDLEPSWMGHSVGKWEGDTLVVDTVGFNDKTWLSINGSSPHSEKLHLTERFNRPDLGHLQVDLTIDDPGAYAKPWTIKRVSDLAPNEDVQEFICTENNRDVEHMVGK